MVILDLCAAFYLGGKSYREADKKELTWLFPFTLVGMVIGITLLLNAPQKPLLILLGIFAAANGIRVLTRSQSKPIHIISRYWAILFGAIGGVFTALYATGGVIYASYLSMRLDQPMRLRATMASSNFGTGLYASVVHAFYGLDLAYAHTNVGPHLNSVHDRWLMVGVQGASQFK